MIDATEAHQSAQDGPQATQGGNQYNSFKQIRAALDTFINAYPDVKEYKVFCAMCPELADVVTRKYYKDRRSDLRLRGILGNTVEAMPRNGTLQGHGVGVPADFTSDKKIGEMDFYEVISHLKEGQRLQKKASWSQDTAVVEFPNATTPICILPISDTHLGSWSTDYDLLEQITKEIVETPNLYVMLVGDLNQMAIKMRGVAEVMDNALKPELQDLLVERWLDLFLPKVLCASWDNHAIMRQENQMGYSPHASMIKHRVIYFPHIGHIDIKVGQQTYKVAVSHKFRGSSYLNPLHAQMRYMRMEGLDREICVQGDTHTPGMNIYYDGPVQRMTINCGTIQTHSTFGKRFFSLFANPLYPCFTLSPDEHEFDGYKSVGRWADATQQATV